MFSSRCTAVCSSFVFVAVPVWHVVFLPRGIPSADANGLMSMLMHFSLPTRFFAHKAATD